MGAEEIYQMISEDGEWRNENDNHTSRPRGRSLDRVKGNNVSADGRQWQSPSETTIYKNAVEMPDNKNISSSTDDQVNTSDESIERDDIDPIGMRVATECMSNFLEHSQQRTRSRSRDHRRDRRESDRDRDKRYHSGASTSRRPAHHHHSQSRSRSRSRDFNQHNTEDAAHKLIWDAERNSSRLMKPKGNAKIDNTLLHSAIIDEGYLQVAVHVDDLLKAKVLAFEYVDLAKLLPQDRVLNQEDQRLTFINKGETPYLVPVEDTRNNQISNYSRWDQAFHVYSEILTSEHPTKAQELLHYNYVIHTAAQTYIWDNVYMYDKDFRIHINHNPTRTWSVILQQAWSMRLKDKICEFQMSGSKPPSTDLHNDYCRRYQKRQMS